MRALALQADPEVDVAPYQALLAPYAGRDCTLGELQQAADAVAAEARARGYFAATAFLPPQSFSGGRVQIRLLVARLGQVRLDNETGVPDALMTPRLRPLQSGKLLRSADVERVLLALGDLAGVQCRLRLQPGQESGVSDLTLHLRQDSRPSVALFTDNHGSKSSGRYRYGLAWEGKNLERRGGSLSLFAMTSSERLQSYGLSYEQPISFDGTKLGLSLSRVSYDLGGAMSAFGANGTAETYSLYGAAPLSRSFARSLYLRYGYEHKELTDDLDAFDLRTQKRSDSLYLGLSWQQQNERSQTSSALVWHFGRLKPASEFAQLQTESAQSSGQYHKLALDLAHRSQLGNRLELRASLHGQLASRNLDASEQLFLGGPNGVRAYASGEGSGDLGWQASAELVWHTKAPGLEASVYYDAGQVRETKSGREYKALQGVGVGLGYSVADDWNLRLDYARKVHGKPDESENKNHDGRLWLRAVKQF